MKHVPHVKYKCMYVAKHGDSKSQIAFKAIIILRSVS